jgi:hypothetical protein
MSTIAIIWTINYFVALPLVAGWGITAILHVNAVLDSKQRYILATRGIIFMIAIVCANLIMVALCLYDNDYSNAGGFTAITLWILWRSKRFFDDDNWFNRQFKKFRNGLKNLGERLRSLVSPLPAPA